MKIAALQMISCANYERNLASAQALLDKAAQAGAQLVLMPEYWPFMGMQETDKLHIAEHASDGQTQAWMAARAKEYGLWLIGGTIPLISGTPGKIWNSTLVFDPSGQTVARYDKIHLFGFRNGSEHYDEGRTICAGSQPVGFEAPCGKVALSICYDVRFPELYRSLAPCNLIVVPAAFTYTTGRAHWEILLRARAIENQCYVLASAQGGVHQNGRRTWGHSMVIDPWGEIVDVLAEGEGTVFGEVDAHRLQQIRSNLPALQHRVLSPSGD